MKNLFILPLLLFLGCNEKKTQLEALQISDSLQLEYLAKQGRYIEALANETEALKWQIDSLKTQNRALAFSVIKIDSAISAKSEKSQRRENTGRFIGGLLKGLIPGLE